MQNSIQMNLSRALAIVCFIFCLCGCNIPNKEKDTKRWLESNVKQVQTTIELGTDFDYHSFFYIPENVSVTVLSNTIDTDIPGSYTLMLNIVSSDNISIEKEYSFLVGDSTPPEIIVKKNEPLKLTLNQSFDINDFFSANDLIDGDLSEKIEYETDIDSSKIGAYPITIKVNDSAGNVAQYSTEINVEDGPSREERLAMSAVRILRGALKNPMSIQVHSIRCANWDSNPVCKIDYSAQNGFGGYGRDEKYVRCWGDESDLTDWYQTDVMAIYVLNNKDVKQVNANRVMQFLDQE